MLKHPLPNPARRAVGLGVVLALAFGSAYAAWAAQPAQVVAAPAADAAPIRVNFTLRVDEGPERAFSVVSREGETFSFRSDGDVPWEGEFVATREGDGRFKLAGTLKRDGVVATRPIVLVGAGEPAQIKVGEDRDGRFSGLDLTVTPRVLPVAHDASRPAS